MARLAFVFFWDGKREEGFGALVWYWFDGIWDGVECCMASMRVYDGTSMGRDRWARKRKANRPDSVTPEEMFPLSDCRLEVERR